MSLWITLVIVTVGIAGIVALVPFPGGSARVRLESRAEVVAKWNGEFSSHPALGTLLAFQEWVNMLRDIFAPNLMLKQRLAYALKPLGWSHDGSRSASQIKTDHAA